MRRKYGPISNVEHLKLRGLLSTIYVSASAPGTTQDGTSWATAYTSLQQALAAATTGSTIEVGQGTYAPTDSADRTATFQLEDGVALYGGYAGDGTTNPDSRNTNSYPSTLSGDIGVTGNASDNSYHVVTGSGTDSTAVLDGFTISGGNANQNYNNGGAAQQYDGGGLVDITGSPVIENCIFSANSASRGGAISIGGTGG